ncbi:hypothetical protein Gotri_015040 [Gossypium trilobum]|uniref:DUF4219 domain-containing protein n=1 Tax=Gossypium trilobum TaxID=34281 RepID=A0A7J9DYY3_9ROSI|nr:hypothetical protein [Gossypium trilobum]
MSSGSFSPPPPPFFAGENYHIWVVKIKIYLQNFDLPKSQLSTPYVATRYLDVTTRLPEYLRSILLAMSQHTPGDVATQP